MNASGLKCVVSVDIALELATTGYQFKAVFNDRGIIVFPGSVQHNTSRVPGIFYEHDHQGNAMAAMIYAGKIEVRGHADFSGARVCAILQRLAALPELVALRGFAITYRNDPVGTFVDGAEGDPARPGQP